MTADRKVIAAILDRRFGPTEERLGDAVLDTEEIANVSEAIGAALDQTPPIIDRLTDDEAVPQVQFGPDVAALVLVTTHGFVQVVGREGVSDTFLADSLGSAALHFGGIPTTLIPPGAGS